MASFVWPVDAVSGSPAYSGRALRESMVAPLVGGATAGRPLGARSGVRPGTSQSFVTVLSATQFQVAPFAGVIDQQSALEAGPYGFAINTNTLGTITAPAGSARRDLISVTISDPAESDGSSTPGVAITYTAGTAGTGVDPAVPARSFAIARLNVPASGGGNPTVTFIAPYSFAAGGVMPIDTKANLDSVAGWVGGQAQVFADTTNALLNGHYYWNPTNSKWQRDGALLIGNTGGQLRGTTPSMGEGMLMQTGNEIVTPNASGVFGITFPTPFPNGLMHINVLCGDSSVSSGVVFARFSSDNTSIAPTGIQMTAKIGTTAVTASTRIIWAAWGW